jgi:hypothetical protein
MIENISKLDQDKKYVEFESTLKIDSPRTLLVPMTSISANQHLTLVTFLGNLFAESDVQCAFIKREQQRIPEWKNSLENHIQLLQKWKNDSRHSKVWLVYSKELESFQTAKVEETFPPRTRTKVDLSQRSIQRDVTHASLAKSPLKAHSENRFPVGIVALSSTGSGPSHLNTRLLDVAIRNEFAGKGFATEAAKAVVKYTF